MAGREMECDPFEEGLRLLLSPDRTEKFLGVRIQIVENEMNVQSLFVILHAIPP